MIVPVSFFALLATGTAASGSFGYTMVYCGVLVLVAAVIVFLVMLFRKPRRHRRRKYKSRNPTLAETEGLPPVRGEQSQSTDSFPH